MTQLLSCKQRYITHVSTDKPIYKRGDTIYIRALLLNAHTQKPVSKKVLKDLYTDTTCKVLGPKGDCLKEGKLGELTGKMFGAKWEVPNDATGGSYTIRIQHGGNGLPSAERKVDIRAFQNPRLNSQLEFVKKGYGAGETATATLSVKRAEGGFPEGASVAFTARVDGKEVHVGTAILDKKGNCLMQFQLPKSITVGDGTLTCVIKDGGVVETASKTIPILLCSISCFVYPEGGDLVNGLESGLYIEAETPFGDPADLDADIVDSKGNVVGTISTKHEGRGKSHLTPKEGEHYSIKVTKPSGITNMIPVPKALSKGTTLISHSNVFKAQEALKFTVASTNEGTHKISVFKRDLELSTVKFQLVSNQKQDIVLTLPDTTDADGVLRVTVFDSNSRPVAERLIFRSPMDSINVSITPDYKTYCPGDGARLTLLATNSQGKPVSSYLSITVTDESVLESQEKRKQPPRLPAMVFLEHEVSNLQDARIYLSNDPKADLAVDLLLGTQGWRRFVFDKLDVSIENHKEKMERIAVVHLGKDKPVVLQIPSRGVFNRGMDRMDVNEGMRNERMRPLQMAAPMAQKMEMKKEKKEVEGVKRYKKVIVDEPEEDLIQVNVEEKQAQLQEQLEVPNQREEEEEQVQFQDDEDEAPQKREEEAPQEVHKDRRRKLFAPFAKLMKAPAVTSIDTAMIVREFAHKKKPNRKAGDRTDFTETLYWNTFVKTNKEGVATVSFDFSDSISSFKVIVDSFSSKGLIGTSERLVESKEPFYIEPKLPLQVTSGDIIHLPVVLVNSSSEPLSINLKNILGKSIQVDGSDSMKVDVKSDERKRVMYNLKVLSGNEKVDISLVGSSGPFSDKVTRQIEVVPKGFPMEINDGGMLKEKRIVKFTIPESVDKTSISTNLIFMPTPAASLTAALESLLKEPSGCFEQTSTTTYPTVIAHQYFSSHTGVDPAIIKRSLDLVEKGYKRLITFECKSGGYEWFGTGPGHEALTAYGTLEFLDMSKIYPVDPLMLKRTKDWLYSRRDGKGGFLRNTKALDSFGGAPDDITNAYIVWSLTEAGEKGLDNEVDALYKQCGNKDTYFLGLVAGSLFNVGRVKESIEIATKVIDSQQQDGSVLNSTTSVTRSSGKSLTVETTAIAILTWLNDDDKFAKYTEAAMPWLCGQIQGGRFGSTQATILALKAIVKYDKLRARPTKDGFALVTVDKHETIKVPILAGSSGTVVTPTFKDLITPGEHTIQVELTSDLKLPFAFSVEYYAIKPNSSDKCVLDLKTTLSSTKFKEGAGGEMDVVVTNLTKEKQGMMIAIIGLPGGMEPRHDQLKELVKSEKVSSYEIRGREVIFYWRGVRENEQIKLKVDVIARVPGKYKAPASRVYLYYVDEFKKWVDGEECEIIAE